MYADSSRSPGPPTVDGEDHGHFSSVDHHRRHWLQEPMSPWRRWLCYELQPWWSPRKQKKDDVEGHEDLSRHSGHCGPACPTQPHKNETVKMNFWKKGRKTIPTPDLDKASAHTFSLVGVWAAGSQKLFLKAFFQMCEAHSEFWLYSLLPPQTMLSQLKSLTRSNNQSYLNILRWLTPSKTVNNSSLLT